MKDKSVTYYLQRNECKGKRVQYKLYFKRVLPSHDIFNRLYHLLILMTISIGVIGVIEVIGYKL